MMMENNLHKIFLLEDEKERIEWFLNRNAQRIPWGPNENLFFTENKDYCFLVNEREAKLFLEKFDIVFKDEVYDFEISEKAYLYNFIKALPQELRKELYPLVNKYVASSKVPS